MDLVSDLVYDDGMDHVGVHEAKTHFSKLLKRVEAGEEITITRSGEVVARLVPPVEPKRGLVLGTARGEVWIADDFDDPLDDELLDLFEGR
jgi:prevent-host-death family protein